MIRPGNDHRDPTQDQNEIETEVLIVGAGPIGLEVAVELGRRAIASEIVDAGPIGATMTWWARGTTFFSSPERIQIASVPLVTPDQHKASREQYLDYLRQVAGTHGLNVRTFERVVGIDRLNHADDSGPSGSGRARFEVRTVRTGGPAGVTRGGERAHPDAHCDGRRIRCSSVVLATGNMDRPRRLDIPGEELPHVSHYLYDPHGYYGQRVLIVGGRNSAVEAAIRLYRVGAQVAISYRGDRFDHDRVKYWLWPELEWLIDKGRIGFMPRTVPARISAGGAELIPTDERGEPDTAVEPTPVACDQVLLLTGYVQDTSLFESLGIALTGPERRPVFDRRTMETKVPGVYVAGTATGGSELRTRVFIETSHVHAERIGRALAGEPLPEPAEAPAYGALEES